MSEQSTNPFNFSKNKLNYVKFYVNGIKVLLHFITKQFVLHIGRILYQGLLWNRSLMWCYHYIIYIYRERECPLSITNVFLVTFKPSQKTPGSVIIHTSSEFTKMPLKSTPILKIYMIILNYLILISYAIYSLIFKCTKIVYISTSKKLFFSKIP